MDQFSYLNAAGDFDYEYYKRVQVAANVEKVEFQWVTEETLAFLSCYISRKLGKTRFGICHGTRRGLEQMVFGKHLACEVLGTEISDTAAAFPHTIQWDFHEVKPEWLGNVDFIYSNSWDHSYDPQKVFSAWFSCLRPGGLCLLEHTQYHTEANEMDPLGLEENELVDLVNRIDPRAYAVVDILKDCPTVGIAGAESKPHYIVVEAKAGGA